jgi:hypothetical protein
MLYKVTVYKLLMFNQVHDVQVIHSTSYVITSMSSGNQLKLSTVKLLKPAKLGTSFL